MKKLIVIAICIGMIAALIGCGQGTDISTETEPIVQQSDTIEEEIAPVMYSDGSFDLNLLKAIYSSSTDTNVFYSEYSINSALSMVLLGASGKSKQEMLDTLGYSGIDDCSISNGIEDSTSRYNAMTDSQLSVANSIWIDDKLDINRDYLDKIVATFDAEARDIDLQADSTVDTINKWISKKTNKMIQKMLQEPFGDLDRLVLINAIYFKGNWTNPFDENGNTEMTFAGRDEDTTDVAMMTRMDDVVAGVGDGYSAISLPYGDNEELSMVMLLPDTDITDFITSLDESTYESIFTGFETKTNAYIAIPKFEIEERLGMNEILQSLGIQEAYMTTTDFDGIAPGLCISNVIHQAKIIVDEQGTEAAAATVVEMSLTCAPIQEEPFEFIANRPFVFFIVDNSNNRPLFTGVINNMQ